MGKLVHFVMAEVPFLREQRRDLEEKRQAARGGTDAKLRAGHGTWAAAACAGDSEGIGSPINGDPWHVMALYQL